MKKIATATAATLVLGGSMAAGVLTSTTAQADSRPAKGVHQTGYVQRGSTVTVYRDGKVAAKITAESVAQVGGRGRLKVKVQAKKAVSFTAGHFLWEDTTGADYETSNPRKTYRAKANSTRTFAISYDQAGDGEVIWLPADTEDYRAGAWKVDGGRVRADAKVADPGYVQRRDTVTVYRRGKAVATVTPLVTEVNEKNEGVLTLTVKAVRAFRLDPDSIIWESADGGDNQPVAGTKAVTVKAGAKKEINLKYTNVDSQHFFWAPGEQTLAGIWDFS